MMIDRPNLSGIAVGAMLMLCSIYLMELSKKKKKCKGEEDEVAVGSVNNSNGKGKSKKQLYQGKKTVCAFLGSSVGTRNDYVEAARALGKVLADSNLVLVYGGGNIGLMGELARAHDKAGGTLHGVIPRNLFEIELVSDNTVQLENQEVTAYTVRNRLIPGSAKPGFRYLPAYPSGKASSCARLIFSRCFVIAAESCSLIAARS